MSDRTGPSRTSALPRPDAKGGTWLDAEDDLGAPEPTGEERYERLGLLGVGGMGEVWRVRDRDLGRIIAMKVIRHELADSAIARFLQEAQCTAQLQHPGVPPVYEVGRLDDGRYYYTMAEVRGRTLADVIWALHEASRGGAWGTTDDGWSLRRVVDAFVRVCEAVGYAHRRGVVHRDLKPLNVLIGELGEVLTVDWGLAKVVGRAAEPVTTWRAGSAAETRAGAVAGTPAYMAPEQARGEVDRIDARTDVWALGAVLYQLLSGAAPYGDADSDETVARVAVEPPPPLVRALTGAPIPPELLEACSRALSFDPADRHADATALGADLSGWLAGSRLREQALGHVRRADELAPRIEGLRAEVAGLRAAAEAALEAIGPTSTLEEKRAAWALADRVRDLEVESALSEIEVVQALHAALSVVPELAEAHSRLAAIHREQHREAEGRGDRRAAVQLEAQVRAHDDGTHAAWLRGDGTVHLRTSPDCDVEILALVDRDRRLVEEPWGRARTPLEGLPLPMGSYTLVLRAAGRAEVRCPVFLERGDRWEGAPIALPSAEELGPDDVFVASGSFWAGGDPELAVSVPLRRVWVDAFVMRRFPVTYGEYAAFLDALEDPDPHVPRYKGDPPLPLLVREGGKHVLSGDPRLPAMGELHPVGFVTNASAEAYAAWLARETGLPWRLPREVEWEKAARGADRRAWPWGDGLDPTVARIRESQAGFLCPVAVDTYPDDVSPYGVRGLGGNVMDWTCDHMDAWRGVPEPDTRVKSRIRKGGAWNVPARLGRIAYRAWQHVGEAYAYLGFRLVRSWPSPVP